MTGPLVAGLEQSEDCLVLSVWAPEDAEGLPVLVWFHGGAYLSGGGEAAAYSGERLAREGLVVVSVTYRLGVLGYLAPDEPNLGLRDQVLALRWMHENAAAFGGDPARVTLAGQSAGADAVLSLLLVDDVAAGVRGVVLASAPLALRDGREALTEALRAVPVPVRGDVEEVLATQDEILGVAGSFGRLGAMPFAPEFGRDPLPSTAEAGERLRRVAASVDLLVGSNTDDAAPFVALDPRARRLRRVPGSGVLLRRVEARVTERLFARPARDLADSWRRDGGRSAHYTFGWAPGNTALGACHCLELPFLFGTDDAWAGAPMLGGRVPDPGLGVRMQRAWAAFATGGVAALPGPELTFD